MNKEAAKELMLKMADDALIYGHRLSEWTGIGPILEEDIAFSSISQDKVGHAWQLYQLLEQDFGMPDPDRLGFERKESEYKCSQLNELYTRDYAFALIRHFFMDHAEFIRYSLLRASSYESLAQLAKKVRGEIKYHVLHADTWVKKLGAATEESHSRMQAALNEAFPYALGLFEPGPFEQELIDSGVFIGEGQLQAEWLDEIRPIIEESGLQLTSNTEAITGGRSGNHSSDLAALLEEMSEVICSEPGASW